MDIAVVSLAIAGLTLTATILGWFLTRKTQLQMLEIQEDLQLRLLSKQRTHEITDRNLETYRLQSGVLGSVADRLAGLADAYIGLYAPFALLEKYQEILRSESSDAVGNEEFAEKLRAILREQIEKRYEEAVDKVFAAANALDRLLLQPQFFSLLTLLPQSSNAEIKIEVASLASAHAELNLHEGILDISSMLSNPKALESVTKYHIPMRCHNLAYRIAEEFSRYEEKLREA